MQQGSEAATKDKWPELSSRLTERIRGNKCSPREKLILVAHKKERGAGTHAMRRICSSIIHDRRECHKSYGDETQKKQPSNRVTGEVIFSPARFAVTSVRKQLPVD
jgi:hypothetical protein